MKGLPPNFFLFLLKVSRAHTGPEECVYEGGVFKMLLVFTEKYPFDPPSLRFLSDFWHPVTNKKKRNSLFFF